MHYKLHPDNPQIRRINEAAEIMKYGNGICIYPTDTVYGMGTAVSNTKAIDRIGSIIKKDKKRLFSFLCSDFSQISEYAVMDNIHFKLLKRYLPGPYTFILPATNFVPKKVCPKRRTVGIRMPDNNTVIELVKALGEPIANTSLPIPGENRGDPDNFDNSVLNEVDIFLDTGYLDSPVGSTIIDLTEGEPILVREGKGEWNE